MHRAAAATIAAAVALGSALPVAAGCLDARWPLERDSAQIMAEPRPAPVTRDRILQLKPLQVVTLALTPGAAPTPDKPGGYAGEVPISVAETGLYQVTLPEAARVDILQNGQTLPASDFTPAKDCPGVRKSVRFALEGGPGVLRISRAAGPQITFAVSQVTRGAP